MDVAQLRRRTVGVASPTHRLQLPPRHLSNGFRVLDAQQTGFQFLCTTSVGTQVGGLIPALRSPSAKDDHVRNRLARVLCAVAGWVD